MFCVQMSQSDTISAINGADDDNKQSKEQTKTKKMKTKKGRCLRALWLCGLFHNLALHLLRPIA
jgi:hypothetical protein